MVRATVITAINGNDVSALNSEQTKALFSAETCHLQTTLPDGSTMEFDLEKTDPAAWTE